MNYPRMIQKAVLLSLLLTVLFSLNQLAAQVMIKQVVGAGATVAANSTYFLHGTAGQNTIGFPVTTSEEAGIGFWYEVSILTSLEEVAVLGREGFDLGQNFPNPTGTETTIPFRIPSAENVELVIYDQLGRPVRRLVQDQLTTGAYQFTLSVSDFPAGSYSYRLIAGRNAATRKMLVVR
ncbi:MAG: T9SS type A sorting domain-containing protein [Lewinella sp.]